MRESDNCYAVARLKPDLLGFIFYPHSPRFVGIDFSMPAGLPSSLIKVGVFVDENPDRINEIAQHYGLDAVQLHGSESPATCAFLKEGIPIVIKSFAVDDTFCFDETLPYARSVDYFLFDTRGKNPGGNGLTFDWEALKKYRFHTPFFLSGGIRLSNIIQVGALKHPQLAGVDLNSGFEIEPGKKNLDALRNAFHLLNKEL